LRRSIQTALFLAATSAFAAAPTPSDHPNVAELEAQKAAGSNPTTPPDPIYVDVGGDTIASATVIPGVPYWDGGNTCQFVHNYDAVCPFTGSPVSTSTFALPRTTRRCTCTKTRWATS
jgi:hypothetical protein